jgi:hypothetical protein
MAEEPTCALPPPGVRSPQAIKEDQMNSQGRRRLSSAHVISLLSLFVAMSGWAYAATVEKNSVNSASVKNSSLKGKDVEDNSLTGNDVKESTLEGIQGPTGAQGATGPQGPEGPEGPAGATNVVVRTGTDPVASGSGIGKDLMCQTGERATGGGAAFDLVNTGDRVLSSKPLEADGTGPESGETPRGWSSHLYQESGVQKTGNFYVICSSP